jgi:hypothetical protein
MNPKKNKMKSDSPNPKKRFKSLRMENLKLSNEMRLKIKRK